MPKSSPQNIVMFDKIMGTDKIGRYLEEELMPQQIEAYYTPELQRFKQEREDYLLPQFGPNTGMIVSEIPLRGDLCPFIDGNKITLYRSSSSQFHKIISPICGLIQPAQGELPVLRSELVLHPAIPTNSGRCHPNEKPPKPHQL